MMSIISMVLNFAGSLCVLFFGMKLLSDGIQKSAGERLQNALSFMTKNRFLQQVICLLYLSDSKKKESDTQ